MNFGAKLKKATFWMALLAVQLFSSFALAGVQLYAWDRGSGMASILIPVPEGKHPQNVWQNYVEKMQLHIPTHAPVQNLINSEAPNFRPLKYNPSQSSLTLGNLSADLYMDQSRLGNWTRLIAARGTKNYVLPAAIGIILSESERKIFYAEVSAHFGLLVPIGGADVDPALYGEKPNGARGFNGTLDAYERELISNYIKAEKGFVYATCRGSQLTAIALGYKMIQDIPTSIETTQDHWSHAHDVKLFETKNKMSLRIWNTKTVSVYSNHHQAIEYKPGGPLELAGTTHDGVTEILEFKNGRGFLIQSHPELTLGNIQAAGDFSAAKKLFDWFVLEARAKTRWTCQKLFL